MKKLLLIIGLISLISFSAFAKVEFLFMFADPEGEGLNSSKHKWMHEHIKASARVLGSFILTDEDVEICIRVSSMTKGLAVTNPTFTESRNNSSILWTTAQAAIVGKVYVYKYDAIMGINPDEFNNTDIDLLKRAITHELTHALGFTSLKYNTYVGNNSSQKYTEFDILLDDEVNPDIFACGPEIHKHINVPCLRICNPEEVDFNIGSAYVHFCEISSTCTDDLMSPSANCPPFPFQYKTWNIKELAIMESLGYKINYPEYCEVFDRLHYFDVNPKILNVESTGFPDGVKIVMHLDRYFEKRSQVCDNLDSTINSKFSLLLHDNDELGELILKSDSDSINLYIYPCEEEKCSYLNVNGYDYLIVVKVVENGNSINVFLEASLDEDS